MPVAIDRNSLTLDDAKEFFGPRPYHFPNPVQEKTIWTLNVGKYNPAICELTYPLMAHYAKKIGARFEIIDQRQYPDWPPVYEKLQIHELGRRSDWNIYIDGDTLVHPDFFDITCHLKKDTVCHNGKDMAGNRWKYDQYFQRDGRHIGSCNWFTVGSNWCLDLWKPLDDLTLEEATERIFPVVSERTGLIEPGHLIDDYTLSRNIARFGMKFCTVVEICRGLGMDPCFLWHKYNLPEQQKIHEMRGVLKTWGIA